MIPKIWKNKVHVPNHQPAMVIRYSNHKPSSRECHPADRSPTKATRRGIVLLVQLGGGTVAFMLGILAGDLIFRDGMSTSDGPCPKTRMKYDEFLRSGNLMEFGSKKPGKMMKMEMFSFFKIFPALDHKHLSKDDVKVCQGAKPAERQTRQTSG